MPEPKLDADCGLCTLEKIGGPEGGWVFQDENWSVHVHEGMEVPGWLTGQIRRHAVGAAALNQREQATLGPLVARLSAAITRVTGVEKVYLVAFGEAFPHWHFLLMARDSRVDASHRGAALMLHKAEYIDHRGALDVADRIRSILGSETRQGISAQA